MIKRIEDSELVRKVVEDNNADALKTLFRRYTPLIQKMINLYNIRTFDDSDWKQEAYIICHETCFRFDGSKGSKFGSFFRLRLSNHFKSLVRQELAIKRKLNKDAGYFEEGYYDNDSVKSVGTRQGTFVNDIVFDIEDFSRLLSEFELKVFMMLVGAITMEELYLKTQASRQQIYRAQSSCREKMINYLH